MTDTQLPAVVVIHDLGSNPAKRLVRRWADQAHPGASIVSLREEWSATSFDDRTLLVPVQLRTDAIGHGYVTADIPATLGTFRQLHTLGNDGGSLEEFVTRSVALVGDCDRR